MPRKFRRSSSACRLPGSAITTVNWAFSYLSGGAAPAAVGTFGLAPSAGLGGGFAPAAVGIFGFAPSPGRFGSFGFGVDISEFREGIRGFRDYVLSRLRLRRKSPAKPRAAT